MCRLYGFLSNEPTKVECTLVFAQNALLIQSQADLRGKAHPHGWGIAYYSNESPHVERRDTAAYEDLHFSVTAERIYSHAVIAHVRRATVGGPFLVNTHPFTHGVWTFAHNGTVTSFEQVGQHLQQETDRPFSEMRRGSTDSEAVFLWLLSRMAAQGIATRHVCTDVQQLVRLMRQSVRQLSQWCEEVQQEQAPQLNFLLTDGKILLATRWNNSLHWVERRGIHDCEICGIPHVHHRNKGDYRALVVASEPISDERWQEVPNRSMLVVPSTLRGQVQRL